VPIDNDTVVVTIHDITEQKRATDEIKKQKELLDSVVDNASSALLYCQSIRDEKGSISDFKIVLANDEAADMSGFSGATDFSSFTITQVLKTIGAEDIIPIYVEVVETGKKHSFEYYIGSLCRWYYISVVKVGDGFLATCTNIEQTKLLQLQLEKTVEELKQSNQNLEEFAYAASHDMKEPIRKIRTFSDRLKMNLHGRLLDQDKYYLERMENATERMRILIDDLLDYSQVSLSEDYSEEVDLNAQVTQVLEDVELEIAEKNADIIVGSLPIIKGNRRQTLQLFQNLLTNALKFNKPGMAPQIRISSSLINGIDIQCLQPLEQSDNKLYHQIIISDSGIGFEQEYADKIFKMFKRLHGKAEYAGTGIGLAIVRKVVDNHKGYITAESKPGEGAAFKIFLPAE
jgi:signal transduction histidine kinase